MTFQPQQAATRVDTGEKVRVVEVLRFPTKVFYRIKYEDGETSLVTDAKLRSAA
jgi:hypothetical protein